MSGNQIRYLSNDQVTALLPPVAEQIDVVARALASVARGDSHQPPKVPLELAAGDAFAHAMPAALGGVNGRIAGVKWISGGAGAPISGLVIVERANAGGIRGVIAATTLTAVRTAAVSGAALRLVLGGAAQGVTHAAIVGGGVQAQAHRQMLAVELPQASVAFYSRRTAAELPLFAGDRVADSLDDALRGAAVIITAAAFGTPPRALSIGAIASGALLLLVDYATTIRGEHVAALQARESTHGVRLLTDSAAQFNATRAAGKLDGWPEIHEEIGGVSGAALGFPAIGVPAGGITIVNHLGIAACDLALADLLLDRAEAQGVGTLLPR